MSEMPCKTCCGTRLKKEALAVRLETSTPGPEQHALDCFNENGNGNGEDGGTIRPPVASKKKHGRGAHITSEEKASVPFLPQLPGYSIHDVTGMTVLRARQFFEQLKLGAEGTLVAEPIAR